MLYTSKPLGGVTIALRSTSVKRGISKPLSVACNSSIALELGVVVPIPTLFWAVAVSENNKIVPCMMYNVNLDRADKPLSFVLQNTWYSFTSLGVLGIEPAQCLVLQCTSYKLIGLVLAN